MGRVGALAPEETHLRSVGCMEDHRFGANQQTAMSAPTAGNDTYPGHGYTLSQLLYAAKRQLQHAAFGGR